MAGNERRGSVLVAGSANVDYVVRVPRIPAPGETVPGGDLSVVPGGKGANQAVAAARAGGAATLFLGAIGDDHGGAMLRRSLADAGVDGRLVTADRPTGAALITVSDDAENAIAVAPGANAALAPGDLIALDRVAWLAMQLETPLDTVIAYARAARAARVSVMLNAAPALPLPSALLSAVDLLVVNEAELAAIAGREGSILERLSRLKVPCAVATLGNRGLCAWNDGTSLVQPAYRVTPVDTTAAGDTFCGVLAAALAQGEQLAHALRLAAAAAALATTRPGAQSSIPDRTAVRDLVASGEADGAEALAAYCGLAADQPGRT